MLSGILMDVSGKIMYKLVYLESLKAHPSMIKRTKSESGMLWPDWKPLVLITPVRLTVLSNCGGRIVTEGHDASIGDAWREEVFQPQRLVLRIDPGVDGITGEVMNRHDARRCCD
jgi:hypothetical protein